MTTLKLGVQFNIKDPWGRQDHLIFDSIQTQIAQKFPTCKNLMVSTTWFGKQFAGSAWYQLQNMIAQGDKFDNIFWLATVDPLCVLPDELDRIDQALCVKNSYRMGMGFNTQYDINTAAIACLEEFPDYSMDDLLPKEFEFIYVCYNRKPKPHRINLVNLLLDNDLKDHGVLTLGQPEDHYDVTEDAEYRGSLVIDDAPELYTRNGFYNLFTNFSGIPYDLCSLGRLDLWQKHFLNIVSETESREWDNRFVTEKTWKPIIGLRPFVINGQVKIYQWLRDNGFHTFNDHWPVDIENSLDEQVQPAIVQVVKYLKSLSRADLQDKYTAMLPSLHHNRQRFFEFAQEQKQKINHIF